MFISFTIYIFLINMYYLNEVKEMKGIYYLIQSLRNQEKYILNKK